MKVCFLHFFSRDENDRPSILKIASSRAQHLSKEES